MKIVIDLDNEELKEFLNDHYGYDEEDNQEVDDYTEEEIKQAIKDEIGILN